MRINIKKHVRDITSSKDGYSMASGEHGRGVSMNKGTPSGNASSGENSCTNCSFIPNNSSCNRILLFEIIFLSIHTTIRNAPGLSYQCELQYTRSGLIITIRTEFGPQCIIHTNDNKLPI